VPDKEINEQIEDLLRRYGQLLPAPDADVTAFAQLADERQQIIDALEEIDGSLAILEETIARSPKLTAMVAKAREADLALVEHGNALQEQLRARVSKAKTGRAATHGYRINVKKSAIIFDKKA